jgi:hypothetical protein
VVIVSSSDVLFTVDLLQFSDEFLGLSLWWYGAIVLGILLFGYVISLWGFVSSIMLASGLCGLLMFCSACLCYCLGIWFYGLWALFHGDFSGGWWLR